jgi:hypothetical protein
MSVFGEQGDSLNQVHCYSQRLLSPFHGVMRVIAIEHGEAETTDGVNWVLYVSHEDIVSHTGMPEIRYGSWNQQNGLKRSMVRGTEKNNIIDIIGEKLVKALEGHAVSIHFELNDCFECWILTDDGQPLALIESAADEDKKRAFESPAWHPGMAAFNEFQSDHGDAEQLRRLINERAGRRSRTLWVRRQKTDQGYSGDAITDDGEIIRAADMPKRLLLEDWADAAHRSLVKDYLDWQAPWLLQLDSFDDETRHLLELQAWKRPVLCAKQFHLFAKVLDESQLKVVRVQARLMGYDSKHQGVIETFIHTGDKENYSS